MTDDKFKDFKVTKLPPAGPRGNQSQNSYLFNQEKEAAKKFGRDMSCKGEWDRAYSKGVRKYGRR